MQKDGTTSYLDGETAAKYSRASVSDTIGRGSAGLAKVTGGAGYLTVDTTLHAFEKSEYTFLGTISIQKAGLGTPSEDRADLTGINKWIDDVRLYRHDEHGNVVLEYDEHYKNGIRSHYEGLGDAFYSFDADKNPPVLTDTDRQLIETQNWVPVP